MYVYNCMYVYIYIYIWSVCQKTWRPGNYRCELWGLVIDQVFYWWYTRLALFFCFYQGHHQTTPPLVMWWCTYMYIYIHIIYIYTYTLYIYIFIYLYTYLYIYICPPPFPFMGVLLVALKTLFFTPAKSAQLFIEEVHGWVWLKPIGPKNGGLIQKKIYPLVN